MNKPNLLCDTSQRIYDAQEPVAQDVKKAAVPADEGEGQRYDEMTPLGQTLARLAHSGRLDGSEPPADSRWTFSGGAAKPIAPTPKAPRQVHLE